MPHQVLLFLLAHLPQYARMLDTQTKHGRIIEVIVITAQNLSKDFHSGRGTVHALNNINLHIEHGEIAIIAGRSGSGKSTLLHVIAGIEKPDTGILHCLGQNMQTLAGTKLSQILRQNVGFVFQRGNLLSHLTVAENISMPMRINGVSKPQATLRCEHLLERVGLAGAGLAMPIELSGGENQRVSIARAIAHSPRLLLADEPTASLDSVSGAIVTDMIVSLARQIACTVVIATHDQEVMRRGDSLMTIYDGQLQ